MSAALQSPVAQQTLYIAKWAFGAPPLATPLASPATAAFSTEAPAAVDDVWVPCPRASRGDKNSNALLALSFPNSASYPLAYQRAPIIFLQEQPYEGDLNYIAHNLRMWGELGIYKWPFVSRKTTMMF